MAGSSLVGAIRGALAGVLGGAVDYVWDVLDAVADGSPIPPGLQFPDRKGGSAGDKRWCWFSHRWRKSSFY